MISSSEGNTLTLKMTVELGCPKMDACPFLVNNGFSKIKIPPCNYCPIGKEAVVYYFEQVTPNPKTINAAWIEISDVNVGENYGQLYISVSRPLRIFTFLNSTHNFHADFNSGDISICEGRPITSTGKELKISFPRVKTKEE